MRERKSDSMRFMTEESDLSATSDIIHDWEDTTHDKVKEVSPVDAPDPLGKHEVTISYNRYNFHQNVITG